MRSPRDNTLGLVSRLKNGEAAAVNILVERYGPRILSAALLLCGNHCDAQDLMIETLQKAVRSIGGFRESSSLFSWLYGILFNLNRMAWRKKSRSHLVYTGDLPDMAADSPPPCSGLEAQDRANLLAAAIRRLSQPHQEVVLLRYYGEMSLAEIAETLHVATGTVKSRLHNATAQLKKILPADLMR